MSNCGNLVGVEGLVGTYFSQVDRVLSVACALFPESDHALPPGKYYPVAVPVLPTGSGGLADGAKPSAADYRARDSRAAAVATELSTTIRDAAATAGEGAHAAAAIRQAAATEAAAIAADAQQDPAAVVLLVTRLDAHLGAMQDHIAATRAELQSKAEQVSRQAKDFTDIA